MTLVVDGKKDDMNAKNFSNFFVIVTMAAMVAMVSHAKSVKKSVTNPLLGIIKNNFSNKPPHNWKKEEKVEEGSWCNWVGVACESHNDEIRELKLPIDGVGIVDLAGLPWLRVLSIAGAKKCYDLAGYQTPKAGCDNNSTSLFTGVRNASRLEYLYADYSKISGIVDLKALGLGALLKIDTSETRVINVVNGSKLVTWDAIGSSIEGVIDLTSLPELVNLDLSETKVSGLQGISKLAELKVDRTSELKSLDLGKIPSMKIFSAHGSGLTQLNLSSTVEEVYASGIKISSVDLSKAVQLKRVNLSSTPLNSVIVGASMANLSDINFSNTPLVKLDLSFCKAPLTLDVSNTPSLAVLTGTERVHTLIAANAPGVIVGGVLNAKNMPNLRTFEPAASVHKIKTNSAEHCAYFGRLYTKKICTLN